MQRGRGEAGLTGQIAEGGGEAVTGGVILDQAENERAMNWVTAAGGGCGWGKRQLLAQALQIALAGGLWPAQVAPESGGRGREAVFCNVFHNKGQQDSPPLRVFGN